MGVMSPMVCLIGLSFLLISKIISYRRVLRLIMIMAIQNNPLLIRHQKKEKERWRLAIQDTLSIRGCRMKYLDKLVLNLFLLSAENGKPGYRKGTVTQCEKVDRVLFIPLRFWALLLFVPLQRMM